jgi:hypothetical protein
VGPVVATDIAVDLPQIAEVADMSPVVVVVAMGDTRVVVDLEMVTATIKPTRSSSKNFHSYPTSCTKHRCETYELSTLQSYFD